jgi:acid phosphatase family membrane protein YuiD
MGVRRATGEHAKAINKYFMDIGLLLENPEPDPVRKKRRFRIKKKFKDQKLKEFIGHTPLEVTCGSMLGIIIAMLFKA